MRSRNNGLKTCTHYSMKNCLLSTGKPGLPVNTYSSPVRNEHLPGTSGLACTCCCRSAFHDSTSASSTTLRTTTQPFFRICSTVSSLSCLRPVNSTCGSVYRCNTQQQNPQNSSTVRTSGPLLIMSAVAVASSSRTSCHAWVMRCSKLG